MTQSALICHIVNTVRDSWPQLERAGLYLLAMSVTPDPRMNVQVCIYLPWAWLLTPGWTCRSVSTCYERDSWPQDERAGLYLLAMSVNPDPRMNVQVCIYLPWAWLLTPGWTCRSVSTGTCHERDSWPQDERAGLYLLAMSVNPDPRMNVQVCIYLPWAWLLTPGWTCRSVSTCQERDSWPQDERAGLYILAMSVTPDPRMNVQVCIYLPWAWLLTPGWTCRSVSTCYERDSWPQLERAGLYLLAMSVTPDPRMNVQVCIYLPWAWPLTQDVSTCHKRDSWPQDERAGLYLLAMSVTPDPRMNVQVCIYLPWAWLLIPGWTCRSVSTCHERDSWPQDERAGLYLLAMSVTPDPRMNVQVCIYL